MAKGISRVGHVEGGLARVAPEKMDYSPILPSVFVSLTGESIALLPIQY